MFITTAGRTSNEHEPGRSPEVLGALDAVLVLSFPDADAIDAYLTDPRRDDLEELAAKAITRSLITSGLFSCDITEHDRVEATELSLKFHLECSRRLPRSSL